MSLFYIDNFESATGIFALDEEESKHVARTLRKKNGDVVYATDGKGTLFTCRIIDNNQKKCLLKPENSEVDYNKRNFKVHIAASLTKNIARIEFFIEKAVEIGLDEFTPVAFKHSERVIYKADRMRKIAISAMKQSKNLYFPEINPIESFDSFLNRIKLSDAQKFMAYQSDKEQHLKYKVKPSHDVVVLIGPEGDFTDDEIEKARKHGFDVVHLGFNRLRTETAALLSCSIVSLCNL